MGLAFNKTTATESNDPADYTWSLIKGADGVDGNDFSMTPEQWITEVQTAIADDSTTIDGGKIVTNQAFVNNLNATGGIIADTISADEIVGKKLIGTVIEGATIRFSYWDLDNGSAVLTNFHISNATYDSNPSDYIDAVYIAEDNEYRIPSMSTITYIGTSIPRGNYDGIPVYSYNTANAGNNVKAVKIRPTISVSSNQSVFINNGGVGTYNFKIYWGDMLLATVYVNSQTYGGGSESITNHVSGFTFRMFSEVRSSGFSYRYVEIFLDEGNYTLPFDWSSGRGFQIRDYSFLSPYSPSATFRTPSFVINNMI